MNKINLGILGHRSVDFRMNFWCQNISESHYCFLRSKIILNLVHSCSFLFIRVHSWFFFLLQICPQWTRKSITVTTQSCVNSLATWCEFLKIADFSTNPIARSWNPQKVWKTFSHKNYPIWGKEWNLRPNKVAGCAN